jgi:hypothetical protein
MTVERRGDSTYRVTVHEGGGSTTHDVTVSPEDVERFGVPGASPERLVEASFEFLLEREPKEAILRQFALPVIERYFPEYPRVVRDRLEAEVPPRNG